LFADEWLPAVGWESSNECFFSFFCVLNEEGGGKVKLGGLNSGVAFMGAGEPGGKTTSS